MPELLAAVADGVFFGADVVVKVFPPATKPLAVVDVVFALFESEETDVVVLDELLDFLSPILSESSSVFFSSSEIISVFPAISGAFSELLLFFPHEHTPDMKPAKALLQELFCIS